MLGVFGINMYMPNTSKKPKRHLFGEKVADFIAKFGGSWKFIISFVVTLVSWITLNLCLKDKAFDPYPFILLNLVLSCIAAVQAPFIMMSQNRQEIKDRARECKDHAINRKAEKEIRELTAYVKKHTHKD